MADTLAGALDRSNANAETLGAAVLGLGDADVSVVQFRDGHYEVSTGMAPVPLATLEEVYEYLAGLGLPCDAGDLVWDALYDDEPEEEEEEEPEPEHAPDIGPMATDRGVLLVALALLRVAGYWTPAGQRGLAATYWWDCQSCANEAVVADNGGIAPARYVYWHQQDEEAAFGSAYSDLKDQLTNRLHLAWDGSGAQVVERLEFAIALCGATDRLRVVWDGDRNTRIYVERYVPAPGVLSDN